MLRLSVWLGAVPVMVAAALAPAGSVVTVPIESVFAGPVAPAAPAGPVAPLAPCGNTKFKIAAVEVPEFVTAAVPVVVVPTVTVAAAPAVPVAPVGPMGP